MAKPTPRARGDAASRRAPTSPTIEHRPFAKLAKVSKAAAGPSATKSAKESPTGAKAARSEERAQLAEAEEERVRFARMMRGVRPLDAGKAPPARPPSILGSTKVRGASRREEVADPDAEARARLIALVAEGVRFEVLDDGDALEGRRLDVDPSEIRKLRQLRYAVDGTLDLHGLDAAHARTKLEAFLRRRRLQGDRAVLVVHGKGSHSPRGAAVLRGEIGAWLSQGKAQRDVAAFSSVQDRAGDSGAVFVLLAR